MAQTKSCWLGFIYAMLSPTVVTGTIPLVNVSLYIDSHSWLSFAFPLGTRICPTTRCASTILDYPINRLTNDRSSNGNDIEVFLTNWGGRPSEILFPRASAGRKLLNTVVFMENDVRFFDSQESLEDHLLSTIYPFIDLAFGFTSSSIISKKSLEKAMKHIPEWKQLAYIDDPIGSFQMASPIPFPKLIPKVAFFSSQCSPQFAEPRIKIMNELSLLLGDKLSSFGSCFHNADLSELLPQCMGIPVHNVDHGKNKMYKSQIYI